MAADRSSGEYRYLDDLTRSDVGFHASGETVEAMFRAAWDAVLAIQIENPEAIAVVESREIELENPSLEMLLHDFLEEQLYYRDSAHLAMRPESLEVDEGSDGWSLWAVLGGEQPDEHRHHLGIDVKAITLYRFRVHRSDHSWEATVVVDV